jgi:hypothetical protein
LPTWKRPGPANENGHILSKNFIVFAVSSLGFLLLVGPHVGDVTASSVGRAVHADAPELPCDGHAYQGVYSASPGPIFLWAKFFFLLSSAARRHHRIGAVADASSNILHRIFV